MFWVALAMAGCFQQSDSKQAPAQADVGVAAKGGGAADVGVSGDGVAPAPPGVMNGVEPYPEVLTARLAQARARLGSKYVPRTRHLGADGQPKYTNRLLLENSPYLLQHAHNPVDWRPWGEEAFEAARRLGRPVLLSVGYATCHWCHVMERESFEDEEIAAFINAHFIAIKVDRERRPDVDSLYMTSVRLLGGGDGGWPMTVVMTPQREPFFAGTYFPARDGDRGARKGFFTILKELVEEHRTRPTQVVARAQDTTRRLKAMAAPARPTAIPGAEALLQGVEMQQRGFDPVWGGFGGRPKFPRPAGLELLLQVHRRTGDPAALEQVTLTLDRMATGGIHDHIGGGFHRYAVDRQWLVPHFEKMLYDQALLARIYLEAWQLTGDDRYRHVVQTTLDYVDREMSAQAGGFYSATDADSLAPGASEPEEGRFFTWTSQELVEVLGPQDARLVGGYYGVTEAGNFEGGRSILHIERPLPEAARALGVTPEALGAALERGRPLLHQARQRRSPPLTDDKVLTGWNGLMISAFARAGLAMRDPRLVDRARRAAAFLIEKMVDREGLRRVYKGGHVSHRGVLDDHAFLAAGLLDLYEATGELRWLHEAVRLHGMLEAGFWDQERGGYFLARADAGDLMVREKPGYDGAVPSGNSVALGNLLRLAELTEVPRYREMAEAALAAFGATLSARLGAVPWMATALDFYLDQPWQVVVIAPEGGDAEALLASLGRVYLPNRVVVQAIEGAHLSHVQRLIPLTEEKVAIGAKATAYVCRQRVCKRPTSDPKELARQLAEVVPYPGAAGVAPR